MREASPQTGAGRLKRPVVTVSRNGLSFPAFLRPGSSSKDAMARSIRRRALCRIAAAADDEAKGHGSR